MKLNFRPNLRLAKNTLLVIGTFTIALKIATTANYSHAHMRGTFSSKQEAENRSIQLGCDGIHKNQDKWLPCENEKELHIYLRK